MSSLKQFIRNVRAAKTIADERAVIQKESAAIRASFREDGHNPTTRRKNVAKLLYLFTLGERTHFGQIECVKLLASPKFADKRLGYLGTMLLLDENQEVLTLVTNSLKNDLKNPNQNVVGLALVTLGNIASVDMSRDLFAEVEELLITANPYIRRKAALCAMRICRKVPDLKENFLDTAKGLLTDRNHGVILCGVTLITSLCEAEENELDEEVDEEDTVRAIEMYRGLISSLVLLLQDLTLSSGLHVPEYDVSGINDPFLQVKILRLLRVLGRGDCEASEKMTDVLAKIATHTDSTKNVGTAVLYEAVLTILEIEADSSLRVLGVNILGRFLSVRDNNIRYVALNTLTKVVAIETNAVQRHRNTILECLRDPDISIRRRALDLAFTLINEANVRVLIQELLSFLEVADTEFKSNMSTQIGIAADRYAPNKRWYVDTMLRVLQLAGNHIKEQILDSFVRLVATSDQELQLYTAKKLYSYLREDVTQEGLTVASAWAIGEYAEFLLSSDNLGDETLMVSVQESDLVDLFVTVMNSNYATRVITEYIITASMKLTTRFNDQSQVERIRNFLAQYQTDLDVEIQQRSVEYSKLFENDQVRLGALEKMPAPEIRANQKVLGENTKSRAPIASKGVQRARKVAPKAEDMLLDLLDPVSEAAESSVAGPSRTQNSGVDALADLLGGMSTSAAPPQSKPSVQPKSGSGMDAIMDLLGNTSTVGRGSTTNSPALSSITGAASTLTPSLGGPKSAAPATAAATQLPTGPAHTAYSRDGLLISLSVHRDGPGPSNVVAIFSNTSGESRLSAVSLQVAVPKSQRLQMSPISRAELGPAESATQPFTVADGSSGASPAQLRLRLRIAYDVDGTSAVEVVNWTEPA